MKRRRNRPGLTPEIIRAELNKGKLPAQIAREWGVTRQAVNHHMSLRPDLFPLTPRQDVLRHFPWDVPASKDNPMHQQKPYRNLRDHAEFMATGGKGISAEKLKRLRGFYKLLHTENVVVEFAPDIPPSPGIPKGGFAYRPRLESDGDLIIRVNEYTTLTEEGRFIWVFPEVEP